MGNIFLIMFGCRVRERFDDKGKARMRDIQSVYRQREGSIVLKDRKRVETSGDVLKQMEANQSSSSRREINEKTRQLVGLGDVFGV